MKRVNNEARDAEAETKSLRRTKTVAECSGIGLVALSAGLVLYGAEQLTADDGLSRLAIMEGLSAVVATAAVYEKRIASSASRALVNLQGPLEYGVMEAGPITPVSAAPIERPAPTVIPPYYAAESVTAVPSTGVWS